MRLYIVVVQNPNEEINWVFRIGMKWFGESYAVGTSLKIDDKQHNKNILLLLAGSDLFSSFSFLRLNVFCSENKNS